MKEPKPFYWIQNIGKRFARFSQFWRTHPNWKKTARCLLNWKKRRVEKEKPFTHRCGQRSRVDIKGPELAKTLPILGRDRIIKRLKMALEISKDPQQSTVRKPIL